MCGRIENRLDVAAYEALFGLKYGLEGDLVDTNLDLRPTDPLPILRRRLGCYELAPASWGFPMGKKVVFNARSEGLLYSPFFASSLKRRCLIAVSGWYEWSQKQRYKVERKDRRPVVMAGLWYDQYCTIITCEANPDIAHVHPRMPVILLKQDWRHWIESSLLPTYLLRPFPQGVLRAVLPG